MPEAENRYVPSRGTTCHHALASDAGAWNTQTGPSAPDTAWRRARRTAVVAARRPRLRGTATAIRPRGPDEDHRDRHQRRAPGGYRSGGAELLGHRTGAARSFLLARTVASRSPTTAARAEAADLVLVCVPTPVDEQRRPQPLALERACEEFVRHARAGQTIVLTSTSYVGATRELLVRAAAGSEAWRPGEDVLPGVRTGAHRPGVVDVPAQHPAGTGVTEAPPPGLECC